MAHVLLTQTTTMNSIHHHHDIPEEARNAARTLRNHGIMQGWGGITLDKPWSIEGIGPTTVLQSRINELEASNEEWRQHGKQADLRVSRAKKERDAALAERNIIPLRRIA